MSPCRKALLSSQSDVLFFCKGDPNAVGMALHSACWKGDHARVYRLLRDVGAVDRRVGGGCTALHTTCSLGAGSAACAQLLLDAGADVEAVSDKGWTPLLMACYWKHTAIVKLLIDAGANVNVRLHWACPLGAPGTTTIIEWATFVHKREIHKRFDEAVRLRRVLPQSRTQVPAVVASIVLRGSLLWSPTNHVLFPARARARAVRLLVCGALMPVPLDIWLHVVMPYAVTW